MSLRISKKINICAKDYVKLEIFVGKNDIKSGTPCQGAPENFSVFRKFLVKLSFFLSFF